jgi:hypothetical protein
LTRVDFHAQKTGKTVKVRRVKTLKSRSSNSSVARAAQEDTHAARDSSESPVLCSYYKQSKKSKEQHGAAPYTEDSLRDFRKSTTCSTDVLESVSSTDTKRKKCMLGDSFSRSPLQTTSSHEQTSLKSADESATNPLFKRRKLVREVSPVRQTNGKGNIRSGHGSRLLRSNAKIHQTDNRINSQSSSSTSTSKGSANLHSDTRSWHTNTRDNSGKETATRSLRTAVLAQSEDAGMETEEYDDLSSSDDEDLAPGLGAKGRQGKIHAAAAAQISKPKGLDPASSMSGRRCALAGASAAVDAVSEEDLMIIGVSKASNNPLVGMCASCM